jgi:outer membrane biosynthesis protein TonB
MRKAYGLSSSILWGASLGALALLGACAEKPAPLAVTPMRVISMKPIPNPEPQPQPQHAAVSAPTPAPVAKPSKTASAKAKSETTAARLAHEAAGGQPQAEAANPAEAAKLREAGLVELNRGAISHAVALLEHANRLDPSSPAIRRDLERAQRISKALAANR